VVDEVKNFNTAGPEENLQKSHQEVIEIECPKDRLQEGDQRCNQDVHENAS